MDGRSGKGECEGRAPGHDPKLTHRDLQGLQEQGLTRRGCLFRLRQCPQGPNLDIPLGKQRPRTLASTLAPRVRTDKVVRSSQYKGYLARPTASLRARSFKDASVSRLLPSLEGGRYGGSRTPEFVTNMGHAVGSALDTEVDSANGILGILPPSPAPMRLAPASPYRTYQPVILIIALHLPSVAPADRRITTATIAFSQGVFGRGVWHFQPLCL